ncbi:MAG TPA: magnesium transporter CorA family protein [Trebonia sp.]
MSASGTTAGQTRLVRADGVVQVDPSLDDLNALTGEPPPFWLDVCDVNPDVAGWLERALGLHPLVIEDAQQFGELPKLEVFDDYLAVVLYGPGKGASLDQLTPPGGPVNAPVDVSSLDALGEVHCIVSARCVITIHHAGCPAIEDTAGRAVIQKALADGPAAVFYRIADALTDSFFPVLEQLDDRLDTLQAEVIRSPSSSQLTELGSYRIMLTPLHKVLLPQADVFATLSSGKVRLPGADDSQLPYLRDVHDHLKKLSNLTDSYRILISGTADSYASVVGNQQNAVMKQLAVIATIFLPLTFLTGFFGQNFGALVGHIGSWAAFLGFGLGGEVVAVGLLFLLFRRRGWLKS